MIADGFSCNRGILFKVPRVTIQLEYKVNIVLEALKGTSDSVMRLLFFWLHTISGEKLSKSNSRATLEVLEYYV